uniref:polysaccharide deacetylase family protein n=1 Tax=Oleiagrimonas sp. TaxID=2010330 RepID=UPI0026310E16
MHKKPVFFDPTGRRAIHVSRLALLAGITSTLLVVACAASLFVWPSMAGLSLASPVRPLHALSGVKAVDPELLKPAARLAADVRARQKQLRAARAHRFAGAASTRTTPLPLHKPAGRPLAIGFYVNWDDGSYPALKRALAHLDWVIPAWMSVTGPDMALNTHIDDHALKLIRSQRPGMPILPMLQNVADGQWNGPGLAQMLADPATRQARIGQIVAFVAANHFQGVTIDFEEVPDQAQADLKTFLSELHAAFEPHDWGIVLSVPFDDPSWDYADYADRVDFELLMAYDQHWSGADPGSIAGEDWFESTLDQRMKVLDSDHTIIAIGSYGYDWARGKSAQTVTFQDAMDRAADAQAGIEFDPDTQNPHYAYSEDDGTEHQVWFLDGATAFNEIHDADSYKPFGYALWRLGSEDPSIWSVMGRPYGSPAPEGLLSIAQGQDIDIEGQGEVLQIVSQPSPGTRTLKLDADDGSIDDEHYTRLPSSYVIHRAGTQPHKIALTFDDGPDPDWTPRILDILKAKHVPATFFIIGSQAEMSPGLVQREVAEGNDVGNHTFTHPNLGESPPSIVRLELNATQRLFEALTGRSMRLFRAPYFGDAEPTTADE